MGVKVIFYSSRLCILETCVGENELDKFSTNVFLKTGIRDSTSPQGSDTNPALYILQQSVCINHWIALSYVTIRKLGQIKSFLSNLPFFCSRYL